MVHSTTFAEGWTTVLNSSRQVLYGHVKSGVVCFQIPKNPGVNLVFKGVSANDDIVDRRRKDRCQPVPHKSKSRRHDHHQRGSQYRVGGKHWAPCVTQNQEWLPFWVPFSVGMGPSGRSGGSKFRCMSQISSPFLGLGPPFSG